MFCRACNKPVKQRINEHLQGKHHRSCVNVKKRQSKVINSSKVIRDLKRNNSKSMEEWKYSPDWCENDLTDGSYVGFVYLFEFEDGSRYIGSKQMYKGVKNVKSLKGDEKENNWRDYSSSSKIVNQKIADGDNYTRTILWGFASMDDVMLVEMILILNECLKPTCLNLSTMHKCKFPNIQGKKKLYGVVQEILGWLN